MPKPKTARTAAEAKEFAVQAPDSVVEAAPEVVPEPEAAPREDKFWFAAGAILILGILLRQWRLGEASFHPDEAIHAFFSQGFATYRYDPTYHGPLLYHLVAGTIGLVGAVLQMFGAKAPYGDVVALGSNDYSVRLVPSLLGILLLWLVLGPMRKWLGNRGALCSAALLAVSPAVVTYSRRLLHDSLVLALTLGAVACFLAALEHPSYTGRGRAARIGLVSLLTLFLATKANCFFVMVMLAGYWVAYRFGRRGSMPFGELLIGWVWLSVTLGAILVPDYKVKIYQLVGVSACVWLAVWLLFRPEDRINSADIGDSAGRAQRQAITYALCIGAVLWLYVFLFGNGAQFLSTCVREHRFAREMLPQMGEGARTAIHRMLEYWGGQQAHPRLPGRHDYYEVLILLYEIPILLAAIGGIWHAARNRTHFTDFLMWWAFTSWAVYAVANEKVPWLLVHMLLPLALLGGKWLGTVFRERQPLWWAGVALAAIFSLRGVSGTCFERAGDNAEPMFYAHTSETFRDALEGGLANSTKDGRIVWMHNDRQWPTFWYLRRGAPHMANSSYNFGKTPDPALYRMAVLPEEQWIPAFQKEGFVESMGGPVSFLIWPRASWNAIRPDRYWRWWWTRQTIPAEEKGHSQTEWKKSILSGNGEWSEAFTIVAVRKGDFGD